MNSTKRFSIKKLTLMAVLLAVSLIIFVIEAQIPLPVPIPGVKLGLSNTVTLFALFFNQNNNTGNSDYSFRNVRLTKLDVFFILICRIILGALFTGRVIALIYSFTGGMIAFLVLIILKRYVTNNQIWVCGAVCAVFHNIGQISAAIIIIGSPVIAVYLPVLIIAGIITGVITGLIAQFTVLRIIEI